jgi:hypothetical protein
MGFETGSRSLLDMVHVDKFYTKSRFDLVPSYFFTMFSCFINIPASILIMEASFIDKYAGKLSENAHLAPNNACIIWHGTVKSQKDPPYGVICIKVEQVWKSVGVHRLKYMLANNIHPNELDGDQDVSHLCHNSLCINIDHLSLEPRHINNNRIACKGRGFCFEHDQYPPCMMDMIL